MTASDAAYVWRHEEKTTSNTCGATQVSEVAEAIANLAPALAPHTAQALRRLLARSLADPRPGELREARMGLLLDLVEGSEGQIPSVPQYNAAREKRHKESEQWPAHSTLSRAYGSWLAAVKAAMYLVKPSKVRNVSDDNRHHRLRRPYTRPEVLEAVRQCLADLGQPAELTMNEYREWIRLQRRLAHRAGKPEPRLPGRDQILRLFGSWARVMQSVRRQAPKPLS